MMMRTLLVIFALALVTCWLTSVLAIEQKRRPGSAAPSRTAHGPVALTTSECKSLGGTVELFEAQCASSIKCSFVDQHGIQRAVCINER
jgi:hypothetical protein